MLQVYSLDSSITSFFEINTTATRQQCDDFVLHHAVAPLDPVPIQGSFSYTVTAGENKSKIFQFRTQDSSIDNSMIDLAKSVHPQFVASCRYHGTIGQQQPLHIYEMDNLPGTAYIMARDASIVQPPDSISRQRNTVIDLAKYFAQSWNCQQQLSPDDMATLLAEFRSMFDLLTESLPSRFLPNLNRAILQELLTELRRESFLLAFPYGALRIFLAVWMLTAGTTMWHYYDNRNELGDLFWRTFWDEAPAASKVDLDLIQIARMAGLFCRYGLVVDGENVKGVRDHRDSPSLRYLNAFCTVDDWEPRYGRGK